MSDLVTRLRTWVYAVHSIPVSDLLDLAADEIELLRGYRDAAEADRIVAIVAAERLRLTDRERGAIQRAIQDESDRFLVYTADVLQSLLDRLSQNGDCPKPDNLAKQDTLTDEEREAVTTAMHAYGENNADEECAAIEATLWGLLERMR